MQRSNASALSDAQRRLLDIYAAQVGPCDEMLDAGGNIRPAWQSFFAHISQLGDDALAARFQRGDQYLRDAGVHYRQYDETASVEREWPFSPIPVILGQAEWQTISAGLVQRADLLERLVRDFYGPNDLVAQGHLPPTLLGQNPAWLRPLVGVAPAAGHFLNLLSFEIGRGPDGKWWVISDLVEAPSTAGFAIENRVASSRVFPNFFVQSNVHRLAGFFQAFQERLFDLRGDTKGQIALLSPGVENQNYAEHAYVARYLGLLLVEGEDLIVEGGQAMVRTVAGPKPLSLLWNRVPSHMCDPLELDPSSLIGTPGLVEALRQQSLGTVNALGAGVLETRALMAFLPKIARDVYQQPLLMPNIATWWCGDDAARDHVIALRDRMMVGSAFSTVPLMADEGTTLLGADDQGQALEALLRRAGRELVGQEAVTLSTTPAYENGALVARPMCLRVFLGRTADGWRVMPGGYARVSAGRDAKAFAMQQGGKVADVWITSDAPVTRTSLADHSAEVVSRSASRRLLPSRAADNLFWLGRYVERAEQNMRLFRAYFARIQDGASHDAPLLGNLRRDVLGGVDPTPAAIAALFSDPLRLGLRAAKKVGDRFSPDGMAALRTLTAATDALDARPVPLDEIPLEISILLRQITGFAGLVHENMYRSDGWRFLSLGLSLERAANMSQMLAQLTRDDAPVGALDLALEVGDSVNAYHARFSVMVRRAAVTDILGIDADNPRSIRYHVSRMRKHIAELPADPASDGLPDAARRVLLLETALATSTGASLTPAALKQVQRDIWGLADALAAAHLV